LVCRRLSQDWQQGYGHPIAAVESFVDSQTVSRTAYKAAGWKLLGQTDGSGAWRRISIPPRSAKQLWVKSLVADAPARLSAAVLSLPWQAYEKPCVGFPARILPICWISFRGLTDTRKGQASARLPTII